MFSHVPGTKQLGRRDNFGSLQMALVVLLRVATCDNWTDLVYANALGCDKWLYEFGRPSLGFDSTARKSRDNCNHPQPMGWIAIFYFVIFCVMGGMVLLTLFVGVVATAYSAAKDEYTKAQDEFKRASSRSGALKLNGSTFQIYREIFDILDLRGEKRLKPELVKYILSCILMLDTVSFFKLINTLNANSSQILSNILCRVLPKTGVLLSFGLTLISFKKCFVCGMNTFPCKTIDYVSIGLITASVFEYFTLKISQVIYCVSRVHRHIGFFASHYR